MVSRSFVTKTLCFSDFYDEPIRDAMAYMKEIRKDWQISAILHMISVISYDSFSMRADRMLHMMFQNYKTDKEVLRLLARLSSVAMAYPGVYLTFINHKALYGLLRVILLTEDAGGAGESFQSLTGLLKAILSANSIEMETEANTLRKLECVDDTKKALIMMQQDVMNNGAFGDNFTEVKKTQELKFLALHAFAQSRPDDYGMVLKKLMAQKGFNDIYHYWLAVYTPLKIYHDTNKYGEGLIRMSKEDFISAPLVWDNMVTSLQGKCLEVKDPDKLREIMSDKEMQDHTCFRKFPVLKLSDDEYVIVSMFYYAQMLYDGLQWDLLAALKKTFKRDFISEYPTDFSEKWLFCKLFESIGYKRKIWAENDSRFDDKDAAPDITVNTKRNIFMFEFKDMRVMKEVADGRDMTELLKYIDNRLNHKKDKHEGNKGVPQLVKDMENYFQGKFPPEFQEWNRNRLR